MDPNISMFIQDYKEILKTSIDLTNIKKSIDHYLPALSNTFEPDGPDFYDELVKHGNSAFFQFLEVLKESQYKDEAEWIKTRLKNLKSQLGLCLIINNIKFDSNKENSLKDRKYSVLNENALNKAFTKVGFRVYVKKDLKAAEIMDEIKLFGTFSGLNYSSYVVLISTHGDSKGNRDVLYGTDMKIVYKDEIIDELNNREYENMEQKHKIVFFQACRGQKEYVTIQGLETDAIQQNEITKPAKMTTVPSKIKNTTIVHSALPGYKCHRLKNTGSVFCDTLAKVLVRDHGQHDLNSMLVTVNKEIREKFPGEEEFIHIEQMGVTESIYFGHISTEE